ncbi:MAG: sulfurtransferase TusA family protein [Gammaproteobacteria bacterium]
MRDFDVELDTSGLNCPLPILKTKVALLRMQSGQVLHVIATDPASVIDFRAFASQGETELLHYRQEQSKYHFFLKKS